MMMRKGNPKKKRFRNFKPKLNIQVRGGVSLEPIQEVGNNISDRPRIIPNINSQSPVRAPNGNLGHLDIRLYKPEGLLGSGNNGEVQKVRHVETSKHFAMKTFKVMESGEKIIDSDGKTENMSIRAIEMELRLLQQMNSPNIIKMIDFKIDRFFVFMLMEYMNCGSLDKILKITGTFPASIVSKVAKQLLVGLDYLHNEKSIIHRDLTLANILVSFPSCNVVISDFGMANERRQNGKTVFNSFVGKMSHMSPSRARGEEHTFISDIWSLGLCLFELFAGTYPLKVERNNFFEMIDCLEKLSQGKNMFIEVDFNDPDFEDFLKKCLQVDDSLRESAKDLINHIFIKKYNGENEGKNDDGLSLKSFLFNEYIKKKGKKKKK